MNTVNIVVSRLGYKSSDPGSISSYGHCVELMGNTIIISLTDNSTSLHQEPGHLKAQHLSSIKRYPAFNKLTFESQVSLRAKAVNTGGKTLKTTPVLD